MSFLKISSNLFLGLPELEFLKDSLDSEGFRIFIKKNSSTFGLIKNPSEDFNFENGKIEEGTNSGTIKVSEIFGIDSDGLFIRKNPQDLIAIPASGSQWYWIKVRHQYSAIEIGSVSLTTNGTLTGTGTKFLSTLRGQPNYPSKISFPESENNIQEYQVVRVIDDQNAIISGSFIAETELKYAVVGTFTPGVPVNNDLKYPFQKDSCLFELIPETVLNTPPTKVEGKEFWLARVRNNLGAMLIEDKRNEIWQSADSFSLKSRFGSNKFIGVEAAKFSSEFTTKDQNIIEIGWGLRTENHTASAVLRQITISNGEGGIFKKDDIITPFSNGDFNGWRIYFKNGKYSIIIDSIIDAGAIKITLDKFDPSDYSASDQLFVCPDVEEVILRFRNDLNIDVNNLIDQEVSFPVNTPKGSIMAVVPSSTSYLYNIAYRHKNNNQYSEFLPLPNGSFYRESSFDSDGNLKSNVEDRTIISYVGHISNGYILVTANPNSYYNTINRIDNGNKMGVRYREMNNSSPLISLTVGNDEFNQQIQNMGKLIMSVDQIINLRTYGAKNGSQFYCFIKGPFDTLNSEYTIVIRQDYESAGVPGTELYRVSSGSMYNGNIIIFATYDSDTGWAVNQIGGSGSIEDVGEIKIYYGTLTGKFDSTGLGISTRWAGWALMNGQNGTEDMRQKFIGGLDPLSSEWQMGASAGANEKIITGGQLPNHTHNIHYNKVTNAAGASGGATRVRTINAPNIPASGQDYIETTGDSGSSLPFDVRPSYKAMAFIQKILDI